MHKHSKMLIIVIIILIISKIDAFKNILPDNLIELLIPTINSTNELCASDSIFYVKELKNFKLWASEMFDASSKFPSGILFGAAYDFGNFDECIEISVEKNQHTINGHYCMAKFHIKPPEFSEYSNNNLFHYQYYQNSNFINVSVWDKVAAFYNDRSKGSRNEFYLSYCIPSSCSHNDLKESLDILLDNQFRNQSDYEISVTINKINCFIMEKLNFTIGDISFICLIILFIFLVVSSTFYELLIKEFDKFKIIGRKHQLLIAFSLYTNLRKIVKKRNNEDGLECIHGLKVISMFLIILGHRIMFGIGSPIVNPNFVESLYGRLEATCLLNGPIIVDTFFNISGFLASYLLLQEYEKRKNINFLAIYIHRIIRLTPSYAIVLAFYCTVFIKMGSGPFWMERIGVEQERCLTSWWANLLYLNNYINTDQICMFQSWYITCDMHYFIITPIIVWFIWKKPLIGIPMLMILIFASIGVIFATVFMTNEDGILLLYMKFLRDPVVNNTFKNIYIPSHMRASPYFVGIFTGYIKYQLKTKSYKLPKIFILIGWITSLLTLNVTLYIAFIFYIPEIPHDPWLHSFYASIHHFVWSLCISWFIIALSEGYGSWMKALFGWKPLIFLSRLTYTAFLCHGAIQIYSIATMRQANYAAVFNLVFYTLADITLSYIAGLILSMHFEAPIIALEKFILNRECLCNDRQINTITPQVNMR